jgi:hypothetical protein
MEDKEGKNRYMDSFLVNSSGWGADPSGFTRVNIEKKGGYRFTSNVRSVKYFNNLTTYALNQHTQNTKNTMGDFDLAIFPQSEKLRFNLGYSFDRYYGPGVYTARAYSDEFAVTSNNNVKTNDFRAGVAGKVAGFNLSFTQGYRHLTDKSYLQLDFPSVGNNPANTSALSTFRRDYPIRGETFYSVFDVNRTFAKKLDFTGKVVYSTALTNSAVNERITGRDNSNNFVDLDSFTISGKAKRPQTRADLGISYRVTDRFTISNSFTFDQFAVNGDEGLYEALTRRNAAGTGLPTTVTRSQAYRVNAFRKFSNLIEADFQFNNKFSGHIGYRFTKRRIQETGIDQTLTSAVSATNPLFITEDLENTTHTVIGGMKIKPTKYWVLFWDAEHGEADNVFFRTANYKFTNFRIRNRITLNKFGFGLSAIVKDNTNPSESSTGILFGAQIKSRIYSGTMDWTPVPEVGFSGGYTYTHQTSFIDVVIPVGISGNPRGYSMFFVRDHYGYFDVNWRPLKQFGLFASYRISRDKGQGSRISPVANSFINSYPMQFQSPEVRGVFRLSKNIDWNLGYQYYNYKDSQTPFQNYRSHLPYTSFTFYFGGADR